MKLHWLSKTSKQSPTEQTQFGVQKGSLLAHKNIYYLPPSILKVTSINVRFVSSMRKGNEENSIRTCIFQLTSFMKTINFSRFPHIRQPWDGRTRKVIPPPWYKGGEGWFVDSPPPPRPSFWYVAVFPNVFALDDLLDKMRYILWLVALLEACDVTKRRHLGRYLFTKN